MEPRDDWTMFGFRGVRATFDSTWAIWADRLTAGSLGSEDVEFMREQRLTVARQSQDSPDGLVHILADSARFAGQPYSLHGDGTERSLSAFTPAQLAEWRKTHLVTSRMLLVVVGNVTREAVARMVASTFGKLPHGDYHWTPPPAAAPGTGGPAVMVQRRLPTNYLLGYYIGPPPTSDDVTALRMATSVLGGRLFSEIRTRRGLTYDVDAPVGERAIVTGGLSVSTVYPDSVLAIMRARDRPADARPGGGRAAPGDGTDLHHRVLPPQRDQRRAGEPTRARAGLSRGLPLRRPFRG